MIALSGNSAIDAGLGGIEFHKERDDGIQDDPLCGEEFSHIENELFGRNVVAFFVFLLKSGDCQLALAGCFHQAPEIGVVHYWCFERGAGRESTSSSKRWDVYCTAAARGVNVKKSANLEVGGHALPGLMSRRQAAVSVPGSQMNLAVGIRSV